MNQLEINSRFRTRPATGVERFAGEVISRLAPGADLKVTEHLPPSAIGGMRGHLWEQFQLPRAMTGNGVLFSPCNTGPLAVSQQLVVIHDAAVWDQPEGFSSSFRNLYRQLLPRLAKRCAAVATVSEFSRSRLAQFLGLPEERIVTLGNAVSDAFTPLSDSKAEGMRFLTVGSLDPRKNTSTLIQAWIGLKKEGRLPDDATLDIIGGANTTTFAAVDQVEDPAIRWLGRVDDDELIEHYRNATAFVFPSLYEGFGLPPLEAMACGCPVLLSNAASLPEVGGDAFDPAEPDSSGAAIYFDPHSQTAIENAITGFLELGDDQRTRLASNAIARSKLFSWDAVANRTRDALCAIA